MVDVVKIVVPGEPQGKARPRFNTKTGRAITPVKTANYETLVQWEYTRQSGYRFSDDAMLDMRIKAFYAVPKSDSKKLRQRRSNYGILI